MLESHNPAAELQMSAQGRSDGMMRHKDKQGQCGLSELDHSSLGEARKGRSLCPRQQQQLQLLTK